MRGDVMSGLDLDSAVAVIGMAGRFPGARDPEAFWRNLCEGREGISFLSPEELEAAGVQAELLEDPCYVRAAGLLEDIDLFDAAFFGYSPAEAALIDPQQRLFLECAWEALEAAGHAAGGPDKAVGVFAGQGFPAYLLENILSNPRAAAAAGWFHTLISSDKDFLATRVSYKLDLRGPSLTVQTACSSSLVAVHLACQSLLHGECDLALAGGSKVTLLRRQGYVYEDGGVLSPDGHCRPFDASAKGTVPGDGVGVVVLRRLRDALQDKDHIRAVILGTAINNDGAGKVGYTAPGLEAQAAVVAEAMAVAGVAPESIGYVEAHGTATPLGDPVEVAALNRAFGRGAGPGSCRIGSVKGNIGHLDAAAGVAGLIKAVLMVERGLVPPTLHFRQPNPEIPFGSGPFRVTAQLERWSGDFGPRRAGVSSFGIGGTNVHVVLQEPPVRERSDRAARDGDPRDGDPRSERHPKLVLLSARTPSALEAASRALAGYLGSAEAQETRVADVAYTLGAGRRAFRCRKAAVVCDLQDAVTVFAGGEPARVLVGEAPESAPVVAFLFPGQGSEYAGMGQGLYECEPVFREEFERLAALFERRGHRALGRFYPGQTPGGHTQDRAPGEHGSAPPSREQIDPADIQPALFAVEYALARLLENSGVRAQAMLGHSFGEYVAATLAGVFALEDAVEAVSVRARLMSSLPPGGMTAVYLPRAEVELLIGEVDPGGCALSLAAINGPDVVTVSGTADALEQLEQRLGTRGVEFRRLRVHSAYHSRMVDRVGPAFARVLAGIRFREPDRPFISNLTGTWVQPGEVTDPQYWLEHLRRPVLFADGVRELARLGAGVLVEVGPGRALGTLALRQLAGRVTAVSTLRHPTTVVPDEVFWQEALGKLWVAGVPLDWPNLEPEGCRVPLPTYPFERERHWVEPVQRTSGPGPAAYVAAAGAVLAGEAAQEAPAGSRPVSSPYVAPRNEIERLVASVWEEVLGVSQVGVYDDLFELGGHSLLAGRILTRLNRLLPVRVPLRRLFEAPTVAGLAEAVEELLLAELEKTGELEAPES